MPRAFLLLAAIIAAAVSFQGGTSLARGDASRPALRLVDSSPLIVRGTGFKVRERVRVVFEGGTRVTRTTIADARGRFVVRLRGVDANACAGFSIRAVGNRGSRATFKRAPGQCPQP
ncbi:MAG: hypothetical protein WBB74_00780 [Gaiellaceae bacterium]